MGIDGYPSIFLACGDNMATDEFDLYVAALDIVLATPEPGVLKHFDPKLYDKVVKLAVVVTTYEEKWFGRLRERLDANEAFISIRGPGARSKRGVKVGRLRATEQQNAVRQE